MDQRKTELAKSKPCVTLHIYLSLKKLDVALLVLFCTYCGHSGQAVDYTKKVEILILEHPIAVLPAVGLAFAQASTSKPCT